jgi:Ca2+-binding RTX toxin-like protein
MDAVITNGGVGYDEIRGYDDGENRIFGYDGADVLIGGAQADLIDGGAGNDALIGGTGDDTLYGGSEDDSLRGEEDNDILYGEAGDDRLYGGSGADTLYGGAGNDTLEGGLEADTYVFSQGSGQDHIIENDDSMTGATDVAQFTDVASTDVTALERRGDDLVISYGADDSVTIVDYFKTGVNNTLVEEIQFSDSVTWNEAAVKDLIITNGAASYDEIRGLEDVENRIFGMEGNDSLIGGSQDDVIDGGAGNDALIGAAGDDNLYGQDGADTLYGEDGADTLNGGLGNDTLYGGQGGDTYVIAYGSGQDRIFEDDSTAGVTDVVEFTDVMSTEISTVERVGDDLVLRYGVDDSLTVTDYFKPGTQASQVEEIRFSDTVTWVVDDVKALAVTNGTTGYDNIQGYDDGPNRIYGFDGYDTLAGGSQADVIDGGSGKDALRGNAGADTLIGGTGDDTYLFGRGDGGDVIMENDSTPGNTDTLMFGSDIVAEQLWFSRSGDDLLVSVIGTDDQVNISDWYLGTAHHVEEFETDDGRALLNNQVDTLVNAMAAFSPPAAGQTTLPPEYQTVLNPIIAAAWQ